MYKKLQSILSVGETIAQGALLYLRVKTILGLLAEIWHKKGLG
jgi:hypothetical protein